MRPTIAKHSLFLLHGVSIYIHQAELQTLQPPAVVDEAAREVTSAEEHRRRLENRQRLRELRIKRLRAKVSS